MLRIERAIGEFSELANPEGKTKTDYLQQWYNDLTKWKVFEEKKNHKTMLDSRRRQWGVVAVWVLQWRGGTNKRGKLIWALEKNQGVYSVTTNGYFSLFK